MQHGGINSTLAFDIMLLAWIEQCVTPDKETVNYHYPTIRTLLAFSKHRNSYISNRNASSIMRR